MFRLIGRETCIKTNVWKIPTCQIASKSVSKTRLKKTKPRQDDPRAMAKRAKKQAKMKQLKLHKANDTRMSRKAQDEAVRLAQRREINFDVLSSAVVTRLPIVMRDPESWETEFEQMQEKVEELRNRHLPEDFWYDENADENEDDNVPIEEMTIGDGFKPAPRITQDDIDNNQKSLNRALKERLFLIMKFNSRHPFGLNNGWWFPTVEENGNGKMKEIALEEAKKALGNKEIVIFPVGNAPFGYVGKEYPAVDGANDNEDGTINGAKSFFYYSEYQKGDIDFEADEKYEDYKWVTKSEIKEYFDESTVDYVDQVLP